MFQILLAPLEAQSFGWAKEIPSLGTEYFLLRHGEWPATVCPIIKGGLNDQAVDHSHCLRAYSASNSDRASLSNDSKEPVIRQVLSPVFGFVEQVEDAQRSDRRLQPAAGGVEQVFAGCAAVQVEGGAAGVLVALRGASQGDEGGRGLCGACGRPWCPA